MSTTLNNIEEHDQPVPTIRLSVHLETHGGSPIELNAVDKANSLRGVLSTLRTTRENIIHSLGEDGKALAVDGRNGELSDSVTVEYKACNAEDQERYDRRSSLLTAFLNAVLDNRRDSETSAPATDRIDVHNGGHQLNSLAVALLVPTIIPECGKAVDELLGDKPLTMAAEDDDRRQRFASLIQKYARAAKVPDYADPLVSIIRTGETDHKVLQTAQNAGKKVSATATLATMDSFIALRDVRALHVPAVA